MTTRRDAILNGTSRAAELHADLGLRDALKNGDRPVDVLSAIRKIGLVVLFQPLEGLLGAYVPTAGTAGMLVTTERSLHIQRFTAAHELGHHLLKHRAMSLDADVGFVARGEPNGHDFQEIEADAFASEFLLPAWLISAHVRRHRWGRTDLKQADVVYQLSLRLGVSYAATCWSLASNNFIKHAEAQKLALAPPKASKQRAVPDFEPKSWHSDVWLLSKYDRGVQVLGNPDDVLVLALEEHVSAGYAWDTKAVAAAGLTVEKDERQDAEDVSIGGPVTRRLVVQGPANGRLRLEEKRPWDSGPTLLSTFEIDLAMLGKEIKGLPRAARAIAA
jgi:IrrE N-terminal-like domain/Chagasin family peptidase inhibitor I42